VNSCFPARTLSPSCTELTDNYEAAPFIRRVFSVQSVLYSHLSSTEGPECPSVETALKAFMHHGRLGAHLQHDVSRYVQLAPT